MRICRTNSLVLPISLLCLLTTVGASAQDLILSDGVKKVRVSYDHLGAKRTASGWKIDFERTKRLLAHIAPRFHSTGRNARVVARGSRVKVIPSMAGRKLDVSQSAHRISALAAAGKLPHVVRLVVHKTPPAVPTTALKGIRGVLSRFTTHFNAGNKKRAHNLRLAASRLDGKLLWPGNTLSLNEIVKERTQKNGFLTATVIEDGKRVPGIGGGASQVAGTLFNAALLGGMNIEQYQTHARPIPYLPVGRDATLSELIDLKVKNPTKTPVYIRAKPSGASLTVTLFGAPVAGRKITLAVNKKKLTPTHIEAELFRIVKKNGKVVDKERIGLSEYKWVNEQAQKAQLAKLAEGKKAKLAKAK